MYNIIIRMIEQLSNHRLQHWLEWLGVAWALPRPELRARLNLQLTTSRLVAACSAVTREPNGLLVQRDGQLPWLTVPTAPPPHPRPSITTLIIYQYYIAGVWI